MKKSQSEAQDVPAKPSVKAHENEHSALEDRKSYSELTTDEKMTLSTRWSYALWTFQDGEPAYLAKMLRSEWPIPPRFYEDLAKIIESSAPKLKGKGRQELDFIQRQQVWSELEEISDARKWTMRPGNLALTAELNNMEPAEVLAIFKRDRAKKIKELSERYGVKGCTIEKIYKQFPASIEKLK